MLSAHKACYRHQTLLEPTKWRTSSASVCNGCKGRKHQPSRPRLAQSYAAGRELSPEPEGGGQDLASEFSKFVSTSGINEPMRYRRPTPMIAPNVAVQSIMTALQMNDYPEEGAGAQTAYLFSKPYDCENLIAGQGTPERVRSWSAHENWLRPKEFADMLRGKPFGVLLNCHEWKPASQILFPSQRMGNKALQAVQVKSNDDRAQPYTFTFCLERIELGPYKGCWLVEGLREGDYASVR